MTQRQHMTYRILCTMSENRNVLLIIPFCNLMFHITWHFLTVFPYRYRDQLVNDQEAKRHEYILEDSVLARERLLADKQQLRAIITNPRTSDSNVLAIDRIRAEKLRLNSCADILWIQYFGPRTLYVNPDYDDPSSTNKIASLITNTKERVKD